MIKRPLNPRFSEAVKSGAKTTTIRKKWWPCGVPIMLYNWSGAAYKSPQNDVAVVVVREFWVIRITHNVDGSMTYEHGRESAEPLYASEGFGSQQDMNAWFRPLIKPGKTAEMHLMSFRLSNAKGQP